MASDSQALRSGLDPSQFQYRTGADPAVLVAVHPFELVPLADQMLLVRRQTEIDDVIAIARIKLIAFGGGQKVVDLAFVGRLIGTSGAAEGVSLIAREGGVAIGASKECFKTLEVRRLKACATFFTSGRQGSAQPARCP